MCNFFEMFEMQIYNINENHIKIKTILVKKKFTVYKILFKRLHLNKIENRYVELIYIQYFVLQK